jgi:hypothetical protein
VQWYNKRSFGYEKFSLKASIERTIIDEREVEDMLAGMFGSDFELYADRLSRMVEFTEKVLMTVLPVPFMDMRGIMHVLMKNRCMRMSRRLRDTYEFTPAFISLLDRCIAKRRIQSAS